LEKVKQLTTRSGLARAAMLVAAWEKVDLVVGLVGDDDEVVAVGEGGDLGEQLGGENGSEGVGRRVEDD
jgi:hypothetical protein